MCAGRGRGCRQAHHGPPQCCQRYSMIAVVDQSPMRSAVITKPIVLDTPLLLPGPNKRRHGRFSWFGDAVGLDQKQLAFAKSKEGLTALRIGTSAEHVFTASRSAKNNPGEQLDSESRARRRPLPFPSALQGFRTARLAGMDIFFELCRLIGNTCRHPVAVSLLVLLAPSYHQSYAEGPALSAELFRCRRSEKPVHGLP
jgi:hypothetical protein